MHNSIIEDVCLEIFEDSGIDFKQMKEKYLAFMLKYFSRAFDCERNTQVRKKLANSIKILVADQRMNNYTLLEPIAAGYLRIIYNYAQHDELYTLASSHLWRQITLLAFKSTP